MTDFALADLTAEAASVTRAGRYPACQYQKVVLTGAALIDKGGRAYELAGPVVGICQDEPGGCVAAGWLAARQLISLPSRRPALTRLSASF